MSKQKLSYLKCSESNRTIYSIVLTQNEALVSVGVLSPAGSLVSMEAARGLVDLLGGRPRCQSIVCAFEEIREKQMPAMGIT